MCDFSFIIFSKLLGIAGVSLGLVIGLKADLNTDEDLVAYILFGFGLFTFLIACLGLVGMWKSNREYLRVVRFAD
jgi:hypothetical protein